MKTYEFQANIPVCSHGSTMVKGNIVIWHHALKKKKELIERTGVSLSKIYRSKARM